MMISYPGPSPLQDHPDWLSTPSPDYQDSMDFPLHVLPLEPPVMTCQIASLSCAISRNTDTHCPPNSNTSNITSDPVAIY